MITRKQILEQLKTVIDPELNINIVDLGLIYKVDINHSASSGQVNVKITMTLTTPGCPLSMFFEEWIQKAVKKIKGVKDVKINLVWEPAWEPEKMTDSAREQVGIL